MPQGSNSKFNLIFHKVELVTRKKNFYELVTGSVMSFSVTRFLRNSVIRMKTGNK